MATWIIDTRGTRKAVIIGAILNCCGIGIRFGADFIPDPHICLGVAYLGQIVASSGQPFYFSLPSKVSANWFYPQHRTLASSFMALTQPFGSGLVFSIAPVIASTDKSSFKLFNGIMVAITLVCSIPSFFVQEAPPSMFRSLTISNI